MASPTKEIKKAVALPKPNPDFYEFVETLPPNELAVLKQVRTFADTKVVPIAKTRETVSWARELLGGNGILTDDSVARFFADAEELYSNEGTYQMQNLIDGKAITGFSAFV